MRIGVVDIGTNSTRLLVADVDPATRAVTEIERRTTVTRLGQGVDRTRRLSEEGIARVEDALGAYRRTLDDLAPERTVAVLTSAVRDAENGPAFTERVRERYGVDARTIPGDEEAALTFLGATSERPADAPAPVVVVDIGGGSTEYVLGERGHVDFFVSTQAGVVRHSERHLHHDPPLPEELRALAAELRATVTAQVPADVRARARAMVAVAGTPTSLAAIEQRLVPYDPARVHGYVLTLAACERMLAALAEMPERQRRQVPGLQPDRAATIVAGAVMLVESLRAFGLEAAEVSEQDILRGAALAAAGPAPPAAPGTY
jgi:exopolyphosphatase/guanosine-5'-triphosphate,3'-diphosphate pyrophosphatase